MRKSVLLVVASLALVVPSCGVQPASTNAEPTNSDTAPTETLTPTIVDAPEVVVSDAASVSSSIEDQLDLLLPPLEGTKRDGTDAVVGPITEVFTPRDCSSLNVWLDGRLPVLESYVESGYRQTCFTDWSSELPGPDARLPNGDPVEITSHVFYSPSDVNLSSFSIRDASSAGIAHLSVYSGPSIWPEETTKKDLSNPLGGYAAFNLEGEEFGIQNQGEVTRVAWIDEVSTPHNVTMELPLAPSDAVTVVLTDNVADPS